MFLALQGLDRSAEQIFLLWCPSCFSCSCLLIKIIYVQYQFAHEAALKWDTSIMQWHGLFSQHLSRLKLHGRYESNLEPHSGCGLLVLSQTKTRPETRQGPDIDQIWTWCRPGLDLIWPWVSCCLGPGGKDVFHFNWQLLILHLWGELKQGVTWTRPVYDTDIKKHGKDAKMILKCTIQPFLCVSFICNVFTWIFLLNT